MEFVHLDTLGAALPHALTDFSSAASSASTLSDGNAILGLFGGCIAPYQSLVKTFDTGTDGTNENTGIEYVCPEVSNSNFVLIASASGDEGDGSASISITEEAATVKRHGHGHDIIIQERTPMPRPRHRHSSVAINGKIWLVGGRDVSNNIVNEIDIYDESTNEWITLDNGEGLGIYGVSDHCAFAYGSYLYIVGGYDHDFKAVKRTILIHTAESLQKGTLDFQLQAPMHIARGGCGATTTILQNALVVGGFTDEDGYCEAMDTAEMYYPLEDRWEVLEHPMKHGRAKPNLVRFGHKVYAFGGERRGVNGISSNGGVVCDGDPHSLGLDADRHLPNRLAYPVDSVEIFDFGDAYDETWHVHNSKWVLLQSTVRKIKGSYRYNVVPVRSSLYFFGGVKNRNAAIREQYSSSSSSAAVVAQTTDCNECFSINSHIFMYDKSGNRRSVESYVDEYAMYIIAMICIIILVALLFYTNRRQCVIARRREEQEREKQEQRDLEILDELSWSETDDEPI